VATYPHALPLEWPIARVIRVIVPTSTISFFFVNCIVAVSIISRWLVVLSLCCLLLLRLRNVLRSAITHEASHGSTTANHPIIVHHALELFISLEAEVDCYDVESDKEHSEDDSESDHASS